MRTRSISKPHQTLRKAGATLLAVVAVLFSLPVSAAGQPPVATGQDLTTLEDTSLDIVLSAVDPEGDELTYGIWEAPSNGTLTGEPPNLTFMPEPDFMGSVVLQFVAYDDASESAPAPVTIAVLGVNDSPSMSTVNHYSHGPGASGMQSQSDWLQSVSMGPENESGQQVLGYDVQIAADPNGVLLGAGVDLEGSLWYELSAAAGSATLSITLQDDGGSDNGGNDQSRASTVTINNDFGADVSITLDDGIVNVEQGQVVAYTVNVTNAGSTEATALWIADVSQLSLEDVTWTCTASGGAQCAMPVGSGPIGQAADLPGGASLQFVFTGSVPALPDDVLEIAMSVQPSPNVPDGDLSNNVAIDVDSVSMFADGMEQAAPDPLFVALVEPTGRREPPFPRFVAQIEP